MTMQIRELYEKEDHQGLEKEKLDTYVSHTKDFQTADALTKWLKRNSMTVEKLLVKFSVHDRCEHNCLNIGPALIGVKCPDKCGIILK